LMTEQSIMRKELLKWVVEKFDAGVLKDGKNGELVGLVHPTLVCLGDRNGDVRKSAGDFLRHLIGFVGYGVVKEKSCDLFSGTMLSSITPLIEAARPAVSEKPKAVVAVARPKTPAKNRSSKIIVEKSVPVEAVVESGSTFPLLTADPKQKDYRTGQDRGANKWTFDSPRKEMVDFLAEQCEKCVAPDVCKLMFSVDHYKERDFLAALGMFCEGMGEEGEKGRDMFIANADLLLKYVTLRFFDTGTSMLIKCLEVVEGLLRLMDEAGYHLSEYEASCFLPFFVNKVCGVWLICRLGIIRRVCE
jgi:cytoskeleton-associated protein 5